MRRLVPALIALCCLAPVPDAQAQWAPKKATNSATKAAAQEPVERAVARPTSAIPQDRQPQRFILVGDDDLGKAGEPLTEQQILLRLSRIYNYQSQSLAAQGMKDEELAGRLLELAMTEMSTLLQDPVVMERPRFQELYRTVITEYERFYGVSADTLSLQFGDIFQFRADLFAAMNEVREPLLEDVFIPRVTPLRTTVPMTMNRLVEQSIRYLQRSPEKHLYHWLSRSESYFPMIEQILREEGVPDELKYLAMIESGLNPRARSWAQAGGMWQFITATGKAYGLDVNSWVDERLDPEKSTRAAARHLRDLYELFDHDWQLALAGYNCSPSRIKRAIKRAESNLGRRATFWDIYDDIPKETRNYVPMFIAAALVASNPSAYDIAMDRVKPGPKYAYHHVPVPGMVDLGDIARLAGTDENTIKALNPELRRNSTPPAKGPYYVRIPFGSYERFAAGAERLPQRARPTSIEYTVRAGDSLGKLAKQYDVSVSQLMRTNDLRSSTIQVGQRLIVPVEGGRSFESAPVALAKFDGAKALTVEYGERATRPISIADVPRTLPSRPAPQAATQTNTPTPIVRASAPVEEARPAPAERQAEARESDAGATRIVYRVRRGDNLTEIAHKYGVDVADVKRWNKLSNSQIQVGQRLHLYEAHAKETVAAKTAQKVVYRVRRGDTLSEIADKHGVSIADVRRWNDLRSNQIRSGQRLAIYPEGDATPTARASASTSAPASKKAKTVTHKVRRGDTLTDIARKYNVSIQDIKSWNNLRSSTIRPGQKLKIRS